MHLEQQHAAGYDYYFDCLLLLLLLLLPAPTLINRRHLHPKIFVRR